MQHDHEVKVTVPEELKTRVTRIKQYLQDNKTTYLVGAGCFVAGYFLRKQPEVTMIVNDIRPNITPLIMVDKLPID